MYDDLPPPTAPKAASRDEEENGDDDVDDDGRDVKRARLSTKADEGASGDVDDKARDDAAVDVQAPAATTTTTDDALRRIAQHLLKPEKFVKASGVLRKLLLSDACGRSESKALFACLENAMSPPTRALRRETRIDYEDLFEVVAAFAPLVFNAKQKRKVEVWQMYARHANALHTDDSFQFSKAVKAIQDILEEMGPYVDAELPEEDVEIPPAPEGVSEEEAKEMAAAFERAARAERAAEIEAVSVVNEKRVALVDAFEVAASLYGRKWSQTTIDLMSEFFHERREKFSPECQERIVRIWDGLRKKKLARKMGVGVGDNGMTSYERDAAHAARSNVSARGAVGSEGCKDGRGESAAKMLG